jgi:hypothetical protein
MATPRTGKRVVCTFWVTIETWARRGGGQGRLACVGAPMMAAKARRAFCLALGVVIGRLPTPRLRLQQHNLCGGFFRRRREPPPALGLEALHANLE